MDILEADASARSADAAILARIRAALPLLGPSERRVASVILAHLGDVVEWSTSELAAVAETSTATVVRACQTLGFRGFQHLRLEIARAVPSSVLLPNEDSLSRIFSAAVDSIRVGRESVDRASLDAAVSVIRSARRLVLVGSGFSAPPVQDAAMRFTTLGRSAEAPSDVLGQQFAAASLGPEDTCLAVSYSGANVHTLHACTAAAHGGATVVAVTSFARSPLTRLADITLVTGPVTQAHDVDPFLGRLSHLLVLHTIHSELAEGSEAGTEHMRGVVADALVTDD